MQAGRGETAVGGRCCYPNDVVVLLQPPSAAHGRRGLEMEFRDMRARFKILVDEGAKMSSSHLFPPTRFFTNTMALHF